MKHGILSIAFLGAWAASAAAQDGGKLDWKGKGQDPVAPAFADALRDGRPMMIFFSCAGNKDCIELSEGAFSQPEVVEAASKVTCIFVECSDKKNSGSVAAMSVTRFPAIFFYDREGKPIGTVTARDGPALAGALRTLVEQSSFRPQFPENIGQALKAAKVSGLPLFLYFYDDSPASLTMSRSINDPELIPLRPRFGYARAEMKKGSEVCVKYDVDRAPTILILDSAMPNPEARPIARIATSRSPRELRRDLEDALESFKSATRPAEVLDRVPTAVPSPKEVYSDDVVDAKFIQARINIAVDLRKQGKKDKAIGVLEDLIQSFPKHVLTKDVRALLEELKKAP
jgi:hypothetical protein